MRLRIIMIGLLIAGLSCFCFPEEGDDATGPGVFGFDRYLIDRLPGGYFYPSFIENYAPDATFLTEENNGFSLIDNPRVYFEGDSFTNFNWLYNNSNINSALNSGAPAVLLPFSSISGYRLQGESPLSTKYGLNFVSETPDKNFSRLNASYVFPNVGGYWATFMIQPSHPKERASRLYTERRKIHDNFFLDYAMNKTFGDSRIRVGVTYFDIQRQFNDFNTYNETYNEKGKLFLAHTGYRKDLNNGYYELFGIFNYLDRSNLGAETGGYPQETIGKKRFSVLAGVVLKKKKLDLNLSFLFENEDLTPFVKNYRKDLMDNDGDGLYPYGNSGERKIGKFSSPTIDLDIMYPLLSRESNRRFRVDTYANFRYSGIKGNEDINDYNAIYFDKKPYRVVVWNDGAAYRNSNIDAKVGMNISADITENISLLANAFVNYNALRFQGAGGRNNISFTRPGVDIGILLFKNKRTNLLFSCGILPYDLRENVNFFLEAGRPSGTIYRWNDINGDSLYQAGEEGGVFGYTGGGYRYVDENLVAPLKQRLLLYFTTPISRNFALNIKGIYKKIKNPLRVKFNSEYGFYETHNGNNIYFFDRPFGDYYLANGGYEKDPFYAQFMFEIKGRRAGKWFFSFSFMAHMGMGNTAFGNGPGSNDIGVLDESQADPNSWINGYGRVDGDRGFVAKSYFGFYITKKLFAAASLKYRDGDPFAFFNTLSLHDQQVIYYSTIKAENEKGIKGGPREDYIGDLSLQLTYNFKLFNSDAVLTLSVFNILDIGAELSEYVFSGGARDAVELQIPRSIRLMFGWTF
jgi:hypothetical protein